MNLKNRFKNRLQYDHKKVRDLQKYYNSTIF